MLGVFEEKLTNSGFSTHRGDIIDHYTAISSLFEELFAGQNYQMHLTKTRANAIAVLDPEVQEEVRGLMSGTVKTPTLCTTPFGKRPDGSRKRKQFIDAVSKHLGEALDAIFPVPEKKAVPSDYATLVKDGKVTFPAPSLAKRLSSDAEMKIASIYDATNSYGGHGPTACLGAGVLHAHVGGGDGIGFRWNREGTLEIHGYGLKSDSAGTGTSGYKWMMK